MNIFWTYYVISLIYCLIMMSRRWSKDAMAGGLGITPSMDTLAALLMCWVLAPVDVILTWIRLYKDAEEARRNNSRVI